jgi:hypothetical protein
LIRSIQSSYKFTRIGYKISVHRQGEFLGDACNQVKGGNPQIRGQTGVFRQRLESRIGAAVVQPQIVPGQKIPGSKAGCPAGTHTRPALVPSQAGTFGILQFGFHIRGWLSHLNSKR